VVKKWLFTSLHFAIHPPQGAYFFTKTIEQMLKIIILVYFFYFLYDTGLPKMLRLLKKEKKTSAK